MAMAASKVAHHEDEDADIPDYLLCPVCFCLYKKEIYQCDEGHVICSECYSNETIVECPQCPFKLKEERKIRNRPLEKLAAEYIMADCTFKSNGCKKRTRRGLMEDHEQGCRFDYKKFGKSINLCELMGQDCNFWFTNGNSEDAVAHLVSVHGAMVTKNENIQMEIPNFKEDIDIQPTSGDLQFWNPVIVDLPEDKCYIFCAAVRHMKQDSFMCLTLFMPYLNANVSKTSDLKMEYSLIDKRKSGPLKLSVVQDLTCISEILQKRQGSNGVGLFSEGCRQLEMSLVKNCIKGEGSLLIDCRLMKGTNLVEKDSWSVICETIYPSLFWIPNTPRKLPTGTLNCYELGSERWNASNGSLAAKKYLQDLKTGLTLSPNNPKAMETIQAICNGVNYENNEFWEMFDGEMLWHITCGTLFIVASSGSLEALEQMLSLGLNVNMVDEIGKTPLLCTMDNKNLHKGYDKAIRLVDAGANIKALDDNQRSLLHWAACGGNGKALKYFIHRGLCVDAQDADGRTPLHYALMNATEWFTKKVVEILMWKSASKAVKDKFGWTPLDYFAKVQKDSPFIWYGDISQYF